MCLPWEEEPSQEGDCHLYSGHEPTLGRRSLKDAFFSTLRQQENKIFAFYFISAWCFCSLCRAQCSLAQPALSLKSELRWHQNRNSYYCMGFNVLVGLVRGNSLSAVWALLSACPGTAKLWDSSYKGHWDWAEGVQDLGSKELSSK